MTSSQSTRDYLPGADYEQRLPSAPRIHIPPPGSHLWWSVGEGAGSSFTPTVPSIKTFQQRVDFQHWESLAPLNRWEYENRRTAQRILPFLLLGPVQVAKDKTFLTAEHITMVLAVRHIQSFEARMQSPALKLAAELGIAANNIDVADNHGLIAAFPRAVKIINDHLEKHQNVDGSTTANIIVYCETGNDRSAGIVAAFLMESYDFSLINAIQYLQRTRLCVNIDDSMRQTLRAYEDVLKARRDVQGARSENSTRSETLQSDITITRKRNLRDRELMDVDDDGKPISQDADRFVDRHFAPFVDSGE